MSCAKSCWSSVYFYNGISYIYSVLLEDISYWMTYFTCLTVPSCFTGIHVLQEGIFYWMIRHIGGNLYEDRFYLRVCIRGSHVLHEGMSCRWTYPAGVRVV